MGLEVEWYDFVCFGIVAVAVVGALWVLWMQEGASTRDSNRAYESLLLARPEEHQVEVTVLPIGHVSSSHLWTTCWRGIHPLCLLATRFLSFLIMAAVLCSDVIEYDPSVFQYYTEWTFTLVTIYFVLGTIVSAYGCWQFLHKQPIENEARAEILNRDMEQSTSTKSPAYKVNETQHSNKLQSRYTEEEFRQRAGFWGYLLQTTYQTCAGAVILTDIVFWCVILPFLSLAHFKLNLLMGCMHSFNAFFLLLDTSLNNLAFPWFRIAYFVLWTCGYVIFQWIVHACGVKSWPYPFLELNTPWAPLWYFCLAVAHIPCYAFYAMVVKAKNAFLPRLFPHAFLRPS